MSAFDYAQSKEMALRLVEKFGTECKLITQTKTTTAKCVFMENKKNDTPAGPVQSTTRTVYVAGVNADVNTNDRINIKNTLYVITNTELYDFDNKTKVLYILTIGK